jgi:hypothetical protein
MGLGDGQVCSGEYAAGVNSFREATATKTDTEAQAVQKESSDHLSSRRVSGAHTLRRYWLI